jgi:alpha-glucosidase
MYRTALEIRREEGGLGDGPMEWLDLGADVLAFSRPGNFVCVVNFGAPFRLPRGEILVASAPIQEMVLPADSAVWMRLKK